MPVPACLTRNKDIIKQRVKDETVLFDMVTGNYYSLNEIGSRAWELLDENRSLREIADLLALEYDAPVETIAMDLEPLFEELTSAGLLVSSNDGD
jgi:hypothetical protein